MSDSLTPDDRLNETDSQFLARIDGLHVGLLNDDELRWFNDCVEAGFAKRVYEGASGFMGLVKVKALI